MIREAEQRKFCQDVWQALRRSDTTKIYNVQGDRVQNQPQERRFRVCPLSIFAELPFADTYLEGYGQAPTAILRLGRQALLAVTTGPGADTGIPKAGNTAAVPSVVVNLEFDQMRALAVVAAGQELHVNRGSLRRATGYGYSDVSRRHAVIAATADGVAVRDLGSANGTRIAVEYAVNDSNDGLRAQGYEEPLYVPTEWQRQSD